MAVRVDEARRERQAAGVDDAFAGRRLELADGDDPVADEAHRSLALRNTGPIHDPGIDDDRRGGIHLGGDGNDRARPKHKTHKYAADD